MIGQRMTEPAMVVIDWFSGVFSALDLSGPNLFWVVLILPLTSMAGLAAAGFVLVKLPATHFCQRTPPQVETRAGIHWWAGRVAKNLLGGVIIVLGAVMALPGVPGPGILTILIGITLTDLPGMRRVERWVVSRPGVLPAINRLRSKWGNAPMVLD